MDRPPINPQYQGVRGFLNFIWMLWKHLNLPDPTPVQYDIARYLAAGPKRRIIEAFRGVGKSWLTAAYVLWRLYLNPDERIMVVSASKDRADAFSTFLKRLISEVEELAFLQPDPSRGQRDSMVAFDVGPASAHQAPSVRSVGITGQMTGGRATIIVADDVESPKNSLTILMRERLGELVKEFDAILVPGGEIVVLGTPQCEESLYNKLEERGYVARVWPARNPDASWREHYAPKLTPFMRERCDALPAQASTDPQRFSDQDLAEREQSYARAGFALQFQLDTRLADQDKYPLKLSDLVVLNVGEMVPLKVVWGGGPETVANDLPSVGLKGDRLRRPVFTHKDHADFSGAMMFVDPSGRGADETSYAVVKISNATLYLVACGGFTDGYTDEVLIELSKIAARHKVNTVQTEPNYGDGMFTKLLQPHLLAHHKCLLEEGPRATIQKERRIADILEPVLNQHRLVVCESVIRRDLMTEDPERQLLYQLTRLTRDKGALRHDDRLDALASAVGYWVEHLSRSAEQAAKATSDRAARDGMRRFREHVFGFVPKPKGIRSIFRL